MTTTAVVLVGVTTRRVQVLDAAIAVLGRQGVRGVTHRAVDAAAGVPLGTTSNYFRTRDALFEGVVERFAERERAAFDELAAAAAPSTPQELAALLANQVDALTLHQLAYPDPAFDPEPSLTTLVTALVGTGRTP